MKMAERTQIERIIQILQRLALKREVTVRELYDYFERKVSIRTLQRDLSKIASCNIPLNEKVGKNNQITWTIAERYLRFVPMTLGSREVIASLMLKGIADVFKSTPLERDAKAFLQKARQLYPSDSVTEVSEHASAEIFGFNQFGYIDYSKFSTIIDSLIEAIVSHNGIVVDYKATWRDMSSKIDGNPYVLLLHKGAMYLVLYSNYYKTVIQLPVQRMLGVEVLDTKFRRDPKFSLEKLRKDRFGIFGFEGQKPQRVVLGFSREIADTIAERVWHPSQKIKRHKDGSLTLEIRVIVSDELLGWIASWREYVEVIEISTGNRRKK